MNITKILWSHKDQHFESRLSNSPGGDGSRLTVQGKYVYICINVLCFKCNFGKSVLLKGVL
jgi:hypothetical protein